MKRLTFIMGIMAALAAVSCTKDSGSGNGQLESETGTVSLSLEFADGPATRAVTAYTESQAYESQVNGVQILLFDKGGKLCFYQNAGKKVSGISVSTSTGSKDIWAVVNGPDLSRIATQDQLKAVAVDLSANSTDAAAGFVMAGKTAYNVTGAGSESASVTVSRLATRVALQKITNRLPEAYTSLTVNSVMLTNIVGNQNLAGTAEAATWYNKMGRKDGATSGSQIIDGKTNKASHPGLTFRSVEQKVSRGSFMKPEVPYLFYGYANPTVTDHKGWASSFTPRKTRLVVTATIDGKVYYYPVVLENPERNSASTVEITITGPGSEDPDIPVDKSSLTVSVNVEGWKTGNTYDEII